MQPQTTALDKEMYATIWVHQNLIKLSKLIGVDISGHDEAVMEKEFKKIRFKDVQELKDLVSFDVKF